MSTEGVKLNVDTNKTVLTSKSLFYKTENFINQTKYISNVDFFVSKLCETILLNLNQISSLICNTSDNLDCYLVQDVNKTFSFMFRFGEQIGLNLGKQDIVFFNYSTLSQIRENDQRINTFLKNNSNFDVTIKQSKCLVANQDFNKLYLISNVSGVNLPKLNSTQKEIVETIDKNVLVQGVAGSGKTNICIDKIIFTACKNYTGKTLYTTFSRGLLTDTKLKIELYKQDLQAVLNAHEKHTLVFLDDNHKKALENKLGIYFFSDDDNQIFLKIEKILDYLNNKVEYLLIEDLYNKKFETEKVFVGENYFINTYAKNLSNHQLEKSFAKLTKLSLEVVYKEIFGFIFGSYNYLNPQPLSLSDYVLARQNSFSRQECEAIYQIAQDYKKHLEKQGLLDNNLASEQLTQVVTNFEYSLLIVDEVQDYTQINLYLFKKLGLKLFCVGDALQMINPSYFNFGYLKNLMFEQDVTEVKQLKHNYRNSKKIEEIIDSLSEINKQEFGTHSFVLKGESVDNGVKTNAVFVNDDKFVNQISVKGFNNCTFVVANQQQKKDLQKVLKNQEVLTVSEIKGLERNTIIAFNILSDNLDKWETLKRNKVNHKQADENSVFRYYYNLFYVGVTRAKQNLFVVEQHKVSQFENFFNSNFAKKDSKSAIKLLSSIADKVEFSQQEIVARVREFIKLEQFDNARFATAQITNDVTRLNMLNTIFVYENYIHYGKYREAGIKFWEYGLFNEAKQQFMLSGDSALIELVDSCVKNNGKNLNVDIVNYFCDVNGNKLAQSLILETLTKDVKTLKSSFGSIKENFKKAGNKGGK